MLLMLYIDDKKGIIMKKTLISLFLLSTFSTQAAEEFKIIISSEANDYVIGGFTDETTYGNWIEISNVCSFDKETSEHYFNKSFVQKESCVKTEERTVVTERTYKNGTKEIIKNETETKSTTSSETNTVFGTHKEASCKNILNNGYSVGNDTYELSNGLNVLCDQTTDGGGWTLIFNHDILTAGVFTSESEVLNVNENNPSLSTAKYSILNRIDTFKRNNKYEFRMKWKNYSATQIWKQTSNPTNSAISGYEAISIESVSNYWGGLERGNATNNNSSLIDGSINHTNWYYAVGSFKNWNPGLVCNGNIPLSTDVAGSSCGVPNVNLWIR